MSPLVVYGAGTGQNDIAVAALLLTTLYFALRAVSACETNISWRSDAIVMAVACGLVVGMKYTFVYFAIPAGLGVVGFALVRLRSRAIALLGGLAFAAVAGAAVLGAYQYAVNWYVVGHPLYDEYYASLATRSATSESRNLFGTVFRSVYAILDWGGILPGESPFLYRQVDLLKLVMTALGLDPERPSTFTEFRYLTVRPPSDVSGFGILSFVCLALSLVVVAVLGVRLLIAGELLPQWQVRLLYIGVGWGAIICFAALLYWDKWFTRFLLAGVSLIVAAVLPLIYERRVLRYFVALPLAGVSLVAAWHSMFHIQGRSFERTWRALVGGASVEHVLAGGITEQATALLRDNFPAGSIIGLIGGATTPWFSIIRTLPQLRFESVRAETAFQRLQEGSLAAVLVAESLYGFRGTPLERMFMIPADEQPFLRLPGLPSYRLFVQNPSVFLQKNRGRYDLSLAKCVAAFRQEPNLGCFKTLGFVRSIANVGTAAPSSSGSGV